MAQEAEVIECEIVDDGPPGMCQCQICGSWFKFITASHLMKHKITTEEYMERYPDALMKGIPPEEQLPLEAITYIDTEGKIRYRDNHNLVNEEEIIKNFDITKYEEMEEEFKYLAMAKSKKVLQWLDNIVHYNMKKAKDKVARYNPNHQLKAAEMLLAYGPPKAAQRKEVNTTIKRLSVTIDGNLPKQLKKEDF